MTGLLVFGKLVPPCIEKLGVVKYRTCADLSWQRKRESASKDSQGPCNFQRGGFLPSWTVCGSHRRQGTSASEIFTSLYSWNAPEIVTELQAAKNSPCIQQLVPEKKSEQLPKPYYRKKYYCVSKFKCKRIIYKIPYDGNTSTIFSVFS